MGYIQVLRAEVDMRIVLFALVSRGIICPWHDTKAEERLTARSGLVGIE